MDRKKFLKNGIVGLGTIVALPQLVNSCKEKSKSEPGFYPNGPGRPPGGDMFDAEPWDGTGTCPTSPKETKGPFPIKTPAQLVKENIVMDREGVPLLISLTIKSKQEDCSFLADVTVDIWQCDADGNYSEYGAMRMQSTDYRDQHFLRGRQTTDANGKVSFISIFPGWYQGRAPHIHLEVLDKNKNSLLASQIAFPEEVCNTVYATTHYRGPADQTNETDNIFANSLAGNMVDSLTGNTTDGFTLLKTIIV